MSEAEGKTFSEAFKLLMREAVREELAAQGNGHSTDTRSLTAKQIADRLQVPESWVSTQARLGKIPSRKLGHYVRFDLEEVLKATGPEKKNQAPS